jgi:signal transduction histidine kinase
MLVGLCATLGVIQYRWIGEVSRAEHERLQGSLAANLRQISEDFDSEVRSLCLALSPELHSTDEAEREREYAIRYARWHAASRYNGLVGRMAIAVRAEDSLVLRSLHPEKGTFEPAEWPPEWSALRDRLTARASGDRSIRMESFGAPAPDEPALIDLPQFVRPEFGFERGGPGHPPGLRDPGDRRGPGELGWTILELDLDYIRNFLLPEILQRRLGGGGKLDYHVEIVARNQPSTVIYDSDPSLSGATLHSDASIALFDGPFDRMVRFGDPPPPGRAAMPPARPDRGRWLLSARHRTGSLEALVEQTRRRNLAVTAGILLLMLAAVAALVQFSRRAQRLAELQMEFVAGVSHELRTPLSVIRTAAHNLGVRVISNANQVQRYGSLIEEQSEKLTDIVDRVLLFSNAKAGRVLRSREAVGVEFLVEEAREACAKIVEESRCAVETILEPGLPPMLGDPTALKHALVNLISNAAKYAAEGRWIGVSAAALAERKATMVEIRVADHGPGIPAGELAYIFDPFYRGKMAVDDQIHGTGLGLSLVERIVRAHGGTVKVTSELGIGTEFAMRIPAAPAEQMDEFADTVNRR